MLVPEPGDAICDLLLQVLRYNEGYPMRAGKEIGREHGSFKPWLRREEGAEAHHERYADEAAAGQAEEGTEETVDDAEADERSCTAEETAKEAGQNHDAKGDGEEGDDLAGGGGGDPRAELGGELEVVEASQEDAEEEACQSEELANEAAQESGDDGPGEDGEQHPVDGGEAGEGGLEIGWDGMHA